MSNWPRQLVHGFALVAAVVLMAGPAGAQTKLKWAHVYEVAEPYHTQALWAAEEIKKRTDGRYEIGVFPASQLGNENQAPMKGGLGPLRVDMISSCTGASFAGSIHKPLDYRRAVHPARLRSLEGLPRQQAFPRHCQRLRGQDQHAWSRSSITASATSRPTRRSRSPRI
jgi:hypothetical protein